MFAKVAKAMMFVAAGALFFALVCPLAATPMPVGKVKRISDNVAPLAVPLPILMPIHPEEGPAAVAASPEARTTDLADLICVRTC